MSTFRIALANLPNPASPAESVRLAEQAIAQAGAERAGLVCFPECFVPGYRAPGKHVPPHAPAFLEQAWATVAAAARRAQVAVILGTERRLFRVGPLVFGISICHEGWRYPETVRWAARGGAHVVFHPPGTTTSASGSSSKEMRTRTPSRSSS